MTVLSRKLCVLSHPTIDIQMTFLQIAYRYRKIIKIINHQFEILVLNPFSTYNKSTANHFDNIPLKIWKLSRNESTITE